MNSAVFIKPIEENLDDCVRECFLQFGGVKSICKGNIFIKINAVGPDINTITNHDVILSTIRVIKKDLNPEKIYVFDNSSVGYFTRLVFDLGDLAKKVEDEGAIPLYLDEQPSIDVDFKGTALDKPIPIPKILHENLIKNKNKNTYINIPILKAHTNCGVTMCIKNQHGLLYDKEKVYNHHRVDEKIVDILNVFIPDFNIVDAINVINFGPSLLNEKFIVPMGVLFCGTDIVAVDTIGSKLIGIDNIKHIKMAADNGFGTNNLDEIEVLPSVDLIDKYRVQLDHDISKISLEPNKYVTCFIGKEKCCKEGCLSLAATVYINREGVKVHPFAWVLGKGHDINELDKYSRTFIVNGPCSVSELKFYFESRIKSEKIKVFYIDEHLDLQKTYKCAIKVIKVKIEDIQKFLSYSAERMIELAKIAFKNGGNFLNMI